jgi:hypothetical protein
MFETRGAYWDTGRLVLPLGEGDPRPDMPETLYRLEFPLGTIMGRVGACAADWPDPLLSLTWRLSAGSDCWATEGGVDEPLDGAVS